MDMDVSTGGSIGRAWGDERCAVEGEWVGSTGVFSNDVEDVNINGVEDGRT